MGAVAAFDTGNGGIISPGMIGFDINCSVRLIKTSLTFKDVRQSLKQLVEELFKAIPSGVGSESKVKLTESSFKELAEGGAEWAVSNGFGKKEDLERIELNGRAAWADAEKISKTAVKRGLNQIGTLGSGNHYLEIEHLKSDNIFDQKLAKKWGLFEDQILILVHTGSRGAGHQIASDYMNSFLQVMKSKYNIDVPDRELAAVPFASKEGQDYYKAMGCGVNISFANKQIILQRAREVFSKVFKSDPDSLGMDILYDVAHNRATLERHEVDGEKMELLVHRKGATASYYPGREEIPKAYRQDGSPVLIGGSMQTASYLLVGSENSKMTFCSTVHGAGRAMSRHKAKEKYDGKKLKQEMIKSGIYVDTDSLSGLAEEAGGAYKDVDEVVDSVHEAGISRKVAKFLPIGVIKG
ncbi:MAG: RtcB family protein [Candidatus Parvarchaeota archaeon]|nr:RtcB family protein [Candidatus Parvarchaeota archaeon]